MDNGDRTQTSDMTASFAPLSELSSRMDATFATARSPHPQTAQTVTLTVAMPVYNERETIREIVRRVMEVPVTLEIVIVDDGSTDGTRSILHELTQEYSNVRVVLHEHNQGKGAAIITAIGYAQGEFLIVQDADLEYDPQAYTVLLPLLLEKKADVVYGSRFKGSVQGMKFANRLANRILTLAANLLFPGARLTDEATCYKMFRLSVLQSLKLRARRFDFCPEVTAKVLKRGYKIHEVPIVYTARSVSQGKKIRWTDGVDALMALIRYRFKD
jgi:glycosyltransferase involved in cell wall biosynthesis